MSLNALPAAVAAVAVVILAVAAPSKSASSGAAHRTASDTLIVGSTNKPILFDPVGTFDASSRTVMEGNIYRTLLAIPSGGSVKPQPDIATSCSFTKPTVYSCTIAKGQKFSDGSPLTADDVVYSFQRMLGIRATSGPIAYLAMLDSVSASGQTVNFKLKYASGIFPYVLTTSAGAIVPHSYPADKLQSNDKIVGAGPYELSSYTPGVQVVLSKNPNYTGRLKPKLNRIIIQYFDQSPALQLALQQGDVDVALGDFTPQQAAAVVKSNGITAQSASVVGQMRMIAFYLGNRSTAVPAAVRQAMAYLIDRNAIVNSIYSGTVKALYSMVPSSLMGHTPAYSHAFGKKPNVAAAKKALAKGGISTPVKLDLWYTPTHYGPSSVDEFTLIQRQLNSSGLFDVTLQNTEWATYFANLKAGVYSAFQLGWNANYPDADDQISHLLDSNLMFAKLGYQNAQVNQLVEREQTTTDPKKRASYIFKAQNVVVRSVPYIPLWESKRVVYTRSNVQNVKGALGPSTYNFVAAVITKK
jgi:peptide/nickel transport system substrate-binding protein